MPWHVSKSSKCPASKPWACIKDADGTVEGCHANKEAAMKQMAALYASEGMMMATTIEEQRAASGGSFDLGARDETWDAGAAQKSYDLPTDGNCYMWRDPNGDPAMKAAYKLPFASKSGGKHAVWKAVTAIAALLQGGRGGVSIPSADVAGVKRKVETYYAKARKKYEDDSIEVPWATKSSLDGELRFAVAPITNVEVRDATGTDDNTWTMSGYAAVFNETTTLYDSKFVRLTESIHPGFFDRILREQPLAQPDGVVHFNFGHDMNRVVAATDVPAGQPGSLQLSADARGLFFLAKVPRDDPDGVAMAAKMRSGVVRQASFAFTINKSEDSVIESENGPATEHRTLLDAKHLYDVCATAQGAYPQTVSGLRSLAAALGQPVEAGGHPHQSDSEGGIAVSPEEGGGVDEAASPAWTAEETAILSRAQQSLLRGAYLKR